MHPLLPSLAAACLYAGAALYQGLRLQQRSTSNKRLLVALGSLALLLHGSSLFLQMFDASGLSLDFFKAASLIAAAVILLTLLACMRIPGGKPAIAAIPPGLCHGAARPIYA